MILYERDLSDVSDESAEIWSETVAEYTKDFPTALQIIW